MKDLPALYEFRPVFIPKAGGSIRPIAVQC